MTEFKCENCNNTTFSAFLVSLERGVAKCNNCGDTYLFRLDKGVTFTREKITPSLEELAEFQIAKKMLNEILEGKNESKK